MANCNRQQLNITCGTDVVLHDRLIFDGETFDPNLSVGIAANLVTSLGKRTALDVQVVDDELLISVPWVDGTLPGCYGLEVTGSCNSKKWATYADSLIRYTKATRISASEVTVESDSYDITQEVGYRYAEGGNINDVKVNGVSVVSAGVANITMPTNVSQLTNDSGYQNAQQVAHAIEENLVPNAVVSLDDNTGTPSATVTKSGNTLNFDFKNLKGKPFTYEDFTPQQLEELTGPIGHQGDSAVYNPDDPDTPDFEMANTTGQSTTKAMTQKAVTDAIDAVPEELGLAGYEVQNWEGLIDKCLLYNRDGYYTISEQNSNAKVYYYPVQAGEKWIVRCEGTSPTNFCDYAILPSVPVAGSTKYYNNYKPYSSDTNIYVTIPIDGYLCVSRNSAAPVVCKKWVGKTAAEAAQEQMRDNLYTWQTIPQTGEVSGYYINNYGRWAANLRTYYWKVKKGETWRVTGPNTTNFSSWAFFHDVPTTEIYPNQYKPWTETETGIFTATEDGYLATAGTVGGLSGSKLMAPDMQVFNDYVAAHPFFGKTCIFIGDSISKADNCYWKGYLKAQYGLGYVTSESGELAPAESGRPLIPPAEEPSGTGSKSIWYRCAAQRMAAFDFDVISLFGGTNDMVATDLPIGTVNDTPYVDDATTMTGVTDVRPDTLTFAAAMKGCIEMLQRDFPGKPIVVCTVMPCSSYGSWTDTTTGLIASEAIAELQVAIAELYGLRHVPFYWTVRTAGQSSRHIYSIDGVHPNKVCGQRMAREFAKALQL